MNLRKPSSFFFICFMLQCMILRGDKLNNHDVKLNKQIKLLNKPAVKIIKTKYGERYGCVDFFKQPAFDNPLLKNHSFHYQMKPTFYSNKIKFGGSTTKNSSVSIWLNGKGCPIGTVPIKRISKHDIIRFKLYSKSYPHLIRGLMAGEPNAHYAVIRTKSNSGKNYNGGGANFGIQNPPVLPFQSSRCQIKIKGGSEFLQAGWIVNPTLYGDNHTHLFTYTGARGTYCFNTLCNGIIMVSPDLPIDHIIEPTIRGGAINDIKIFIYKDRFNGDWWLQVGQEDQNIAVWPNKIFEGLANYASGIEWGGHTYSKKGLASPQMGFGEIPNESQKYVAFGINVATINETHHIVGDEETETFTDNAKYYNVIDKGVDGKLGHWFLYGGPGGIIEN